MEGNVRDNGRDFRRTKKKRIRPKRTVFDLKNSNFKRSFAPRTWLRSARNFGKTRFGRFATFDFFTPKIVFWIFFRNFFRFFVILGRFWRSYGFLTSKSTSTSNFASDTPFLRSVRPKIGVSSSLNTRNVLLRTEGMSFFEHRECLSSNTRNVFLRTKGLSFFEHKELSFFNHKDFFRTQGILFLQTQGILMRCNPFTICS